MSIASTDGSCRSTIDIALAVAELEHDESYKLTYLSRVPPTGSSSNNTIPVFSFVLALLWVIIDPPSTRVTPDYSTI